MHNDTTLDFANAFLSFPFLSLSVNSRAELVSSPQAYGWISAVGSVIISFKLVIPTVAMR